MVALAARPGCEEPWPRSASSTSSTPPLLVGSSPSPMTAGATPPYGGTATAAFGFARSAPDSWIGRTAIGRVHRAWSSSAARSSPSSPPLGRSRCSPLARAGRWNRGARGGGGDRIAQDGVPDRIRSRRAGVTGSRHGVGRRRGVPRRAATGQPVGRHRLVGLAVPRPSRVRRAAHGGPGRHRSAPRPRIVRRAVVTSGPRRDGQVPDHDSVTWSVRQPRAIVELVGTSPRRLRGRPGCSRARAASAGTVDSNALATPARARRLTPMLVDTAAADPIRVRRQHRRTSARPGALGALTVLGLLAVLVSVLAVLVVHEGQPPVVQRWPGSLAQPLEELREGLAVGVEVVLEALLGTWWMVCRSCATGMPLECFRTMRTVTPGRVVTCPRHRAPPSRPQPALLPGGSSRQVRPRRNRRHRRRHRPSNTPMTE